MKGLASLSSALHERVLGAMLRRAEHGLIRIAGPDGTHYEQRGPHDGPVAALSICHWRALRRLIFGCALGFAESYLDGEWDTPELASVLRYGAVNLDTEAANLLQYQQAYEASGKVIQTAQTVFDSLLQAIT